MEVLINLISWIVILLILYLIRRPIFRFFKNAGRNAYDRAVAWVGGIILVVIVAFIIFLLGR